VVGETGLVPEDERVAGTESDVAIWGVTIFDVAKAELAAVADADRDDGFVDDLVLVLVHAEPRALGVVVHQGGIGLIATGVVELVGVDDSGAAQVGEPVGELEDASAVDVGGDARVSVGLPMPAETDGLDGHAVAAGQRSGPNRHGAGGPLAERGHHSLLVGAGEPSGKVNGTRGESAGRRFASESRERERHR